ncbi:unnamed protein product [Pleuronectes platessa]|uniref:Uncharacterized protein n=1 Tax=Pleuronectes platessa TaxID=8262 RepID=A0A9N7UGR2_PLEPL|nr:unnamed protein product [Pleuronectes platessa]
MWAEVGPACRGGGGGLRGYIQRGVRQTSAAPACTRASGLTPVRTGTSCRCASRRPSSQSPPVRGVVVWTGGGAGDTLFGVSLLVNGTRCQIWVGGVCVGGGGSRPRPPSVALCAAIGEASEDELQHRRASAGNNPPFVQLPASHCPESCLE